MPWLSVLVVFTCGWWFDCLLVVAWDSWHFMFVCVCVGSLILGVACFSYFVALIRYLCVILV